MTYVVYIMDDDGKPTTKFLAVAETKIERNKSLHKWWKAFREGEKAKPENYGGVAYSHVAEFDDWVTPEDL